MTKKAKLLLFLICICLIMVGYLIISSKSVTVQPIDNNQQNKTDKPIDNQIIKINEEELIKSYEQEAALLLADIGVQTRELMASSTDEIATATADELNKKLTVEEAAAIKNGLLALRVPAKYKDLHVNLILALDKMENYLADGNEINRTGSEELINQAWNQYPWLLAR